MPKHLPLRRLGRQSRRVILTSSWSPDLEGHPPCLELSIRMDNFVVATLWKKTSAPYTYHNICIDDISYDMMKHDISFLANPSQHLRNHLTLTPRVILVIVVSKQLVPHLLSLILLKGRTMAYQHTWGNSLLLPWDS